MLIEKGLEKVRCVASVGAPNPKEHSYWVDLTADAVGRILKTFDGRSGWMQCSYSVPETDEQMNGVYETIEGLENKLTEMIEQLREELTAMINNLQTQITSLSSTVSSHTSSISSLSSRVTSLESRVSALE